MYNTPDSVVNNDDTIYIYIYWQYTYTVDKYNNYLYQVYKTGDLVFQFRDEC